MISSAQLASDYVDRLTDLGLSGDDIRALNNPLLGMVVIVRSHPDHLDIHEFEESWSSKEALKFVLGEGKV